jgi:hypothetical protein
MCDCKTDRRWWNRKVTFRVTNAFAVFTLFSSKPLLADQLCFDYWVDKFDNGFDKFLHQLKLTLGPMKWLRTKCSDCLKVEIFPLIEAVCVASRKSNYKLFTECDCNDCFTKETPAKIEEHVETFWKAYCLSYYYQQRHSDQPNRDHLICESYPSDPVELLQFDAEQLKNYTCHHHLPEFADGQ